MAAVDEKKLEAIVSQQIQLAKSHDSRERETDRAKALDYYLGKMDKYVPVEVNRSAVVSRDVADTIGWMLPGIIRVFTASDRMAVAEPVGEEDVQFARQATDGMNYVFWKDNKGYEIVYAATWDALLVGNGVVKTYYDETPVYTISFHSGLYEDQVALLLQEDEKGEAPEVLAQTEKTKTIFDEAGMPQEVPCYDLKIKRKKADGKFIIECIPPEQFLIHEDAICTDDAAFTAHWERKMRSDLVAMGYDKDTVSEIPAAGRNETPEEASRRELSPTDAADKSTELVDYYECFVRIDVDDDGEAELVRVCFGGSDNGKLLHWETWEDENPFDDIPCEPIPHRWVARSVSDETMDVQDVKTVLTRQALNNIYASNNPRTAVIGGGVDNPDELVNPSFGGTVYAKAGTEIIPLTVPFVANHAFEMMAQQDEVIQRRTGVSRQGMALDPETLQNQTATASQQQHDASYSQVEQIARNMAEWGWSKVFRKLLRLLIKHQGPRSLMMNGKAIQIDPRFWNADMDVTINVGLGTGSRDRDLMHLQGVLATQTALIDRFMAAGATDDAIDMLPKIVRTMEKMAESAGIRNPEDFYPEYTQEKVAHLKDMAKQRASQPDPKVQMEQAKLQADMQRGQAEMQMDGQKAQQDVQLQQQKMESDIVLQREKMQGELMLKREQLAAEMQLKREQLAAELQLKQALSMQEMQMKREQGFYQADRTAEVGRYKADATSKVHVGGDPG